MSGSSSPSKERIAIQLKHGRTILANKVVIAAGAWSHLLARQLGDRIPLETERGYNTTLPKTAFDVKRMLIFSGHGFVITRLENGVRVGGAVELGGLEARRRTTPVQRRCSKRRKNSCRGSMPVAVANGWGSAVAAGLAAGDRPLAKPGECVLCLRPRPSRPDPVGRDGPVDPRPRSRAGSGDRS